MANNLINDNSFRLVITCNIDDNLEYIECDTINDVQVSESSSITTQPIVSGDVISDHMFRQPITVSFSGTFSLNGNQPTSFTGGSDRLSSIQYTFERIKNEGLFCTLTTMNRSDRSITRFLVRPNMVLTMITWTEHQNSIDYSFTFQEALTVDIYEDVPVTLDDENLPAITDAASLDFTDNFLDSQVVLEQIVQILTDYDLFGKDFGEYFCANCPQDMLIGFGIGAAIAGVIVAVAIKITIAAFGATYLAGLAVSTGVLATTAGVLSCVPVGGWIAAGAVLLAGVVAGAIAAAVKAGKKTNAEKTFTKAFKYYKNNDAKNKQEAERFANYLSQVYENLEVLEDVCQVYGISSNQAQECMLYIDDEYYIFKFEKNNTTNVWSCSVTDVNGTVKGKPITDLTSCITSIEQCTSSNILFKTSSGFSVYLMSLAEAKAGVREVEVDGETTTQEISLDEAQKDLTNYVMLVSQIDMSEFSNILKDLTINAMKRAS